MACARRSSASPSSAACPTSSEAKQAADAASEGFAPGVLAPTEVDLIAPGIADRSPELGKLESAGRPAAGRRRGRRPARATARPVPAGDGLRGRAGAARVAVVFDDDPLGAPAIDTWTRSRTGCRRCSPRPGVDPPPQVSFAGQTALAGETVDAVLDDLKRIGVVALVANLVLLMIFLRALAAPLYLVASSVLGLAATLGLTTFFFQDLLGRDELTYYVPFAAAVLLVALGSDYNVFVAGRIWKEARWRRVPEAIAVATPSAAKAITVAGMALAASFALLAIVPLDAFQEFAFVMVVGVLIDTFIVRSLLIPALTALVGERAWWPGRPAASISSEAFEERVAERGRRSRSERRSGRPRRRWRRSASESTSASGGSSRRQLPDHLSDCLLEAESGPEQFPADEFIARMRERDGARVGRRCRATTPGRCCDARRDRARRPRLRPRPALRGLRSALRRAARRRLARRRQASLDAGGDGSPKRHSGQALDEPSSQPVAGCRGQDPANHRSQQIGAGASEFTGVGFKNDLGRRTSRRS